MGDWFCRRGLRRDPCGADGDAIRTLDATVAYIAQHLTVYQNDPATFLPPWM
jgi:hypothetical protein